MPNAKVLVEGKWLAYVAGSAGVKNLFVDDKKGNLVILSEDNIMEISGCPFILEREYKKTEEK